MPEWKIKTIKKKKLANPVLIEGMPGIGNVGKIAADLIIEQLKAEKIMSMTSDCLPNSVFVREDNTVELPRIDIYHKKKNNKDLLFLAGDVQPMKEQDSYSFARAVLEMAAKKGCKSIITLGGIGLQTPPKSPKVYCTGNDKKFIDEMVKLGADKKLYGIVGPIMGVSGLLLGLGKEKGIKAVTLLAETYAHPMHIGLRGAKAIMKLLDQKYKLKIDFKKLEKDIKSIENEMKATSLQQDPEQAGPGAIGRKDMNYIG